MTLLREQGLFGVSPTEETMDWTNDFEAYQASNEVRRHRIKNTFGGRIWPRRIITVIEPNRQLEIAMAALAKLEAQEAS